MNDLNMLLVKFITELEPENMTTKEIRAQTEYERCNFERALLLSLQGQLLRTFPPHLGECARHAAETVGMLIKY